MPTRRLLALPVLLALLVPSSTPVPLVAADSGRWYVAPGGDNGNDCLSDLTPCRTIQAAINKASADDVVHAAAGTYSLATNGEVFPVTIDKGLIIHGAGMTVTTIDANNPAVDVVWASGPFLLVFDGFTVTGGNYGLRLEGWSPTQVMRGQVSWCRFTDNVWGVYAFRYSGEIARNEFDGNAEVGIYNEYAEPWIRKNSIAWNGGGGSNAGIFNFHSNPTIVNNLLAWNNGAGIHNRDSSPTITNNTLSFNYGGDGILNVVSSSPQVVNNIVTANGLAGIAADGTSFPVNSYNDVWGNLFGDYSGASGEAGSISADPRFVSLLNAHLGCSSPAINHGNNSAPGAPSEDYDQNPRPVGGTVDMGAYEWQSPFLCPVCLPLVIR